MNKIGLSVIIIAYNEEKNISRCIKSAQKVSDDIILVDSFSKDQTTAIATKLGVRVIQQTFSGYAQQKNFAATFAKYSYVLSLDADEELSAELIYSIQSIETNNANVVYNFNRLTYYCGRWIKHCGWYPDTKIRIYNPSHAQWGGDSIHETLIYEPTCKLIHLSGDLNHYSYYTYSDHLKQLDKFTDLQAQELFNKGLHPNIYHYLLKPYLKFFRDYFIKFGFLDGWQGMSISILSAVGVYLKYQKLNILVKNKTL